MVKEKVEYRLNPETKKLSTLVEYRRYWSAWGGNPHAIDAYWHSFPVIEVPEGKFEEVQAKLAYIYKEDVQKPMTIEGGMMKQIKFYNELMITLGYPEDQIYMKYCGDI